MPEVSSKAKHKVFAGKAHFLELISITMNPRF
jgi:hypothetical protein